MLHSKLRMGRPAPPVAPLSRTPIAANAACDRRPAKAVATSNMHNFVDTPSPNRAFENDARKRARLTPNVIPQPNPQILSQAIHADILAT